MTEHFSGNTVDRRPTAPTGLAEFSRVFRVTGYFASSDPARAAAWAVRNLVNVVKNWPIGAMIWVILVSQGKSSKLYLALNDAALDGGLKSVRYIVRPIGHVKRVSQLPRLADAQIEVRPLRPRQGDMLAELLDEPERKAGYGRKAVTVGNLDPMWDMLTEMDWPGAAISAILAPASPLEQEMVESSWNDSLTGGSETEHQMYIGTPILARAWLHGVNGVPTSALAEMMMMSQRIEIQPLDADGRRELRNPTVDCLKGWGIPEGAAPAIVHLPAAAIGGRNPRLVVLPPPPFRALYRRPVKPPVAIDLGRCSTDKGKYGRVWLSPADGFRHLQGTGMTGAGKSTLLRMYVEGWMKAGGVAIVLDPHGTLCTDIIGDWPDPDQLVHADFSDPDHIVPYNLLRAKTLVQFEARVQTVIAIIADRWPKSFFGPVGQRAFMLVAQGCWALWGPNSNLVQVFAILSSRDRVRALGEAVSVINPVLGGQILHEIGDIRGEDNSNHWLWFAAKGAEILGSQIMIRIMGTGENALDLAGIVAAGKSVLINLGLTQLGELSAQLLGCMLTGDGQLLARGRSDRTTPVLIAIDEAHLFQYGPLPSLLDESRKLNVGIAVFHQRPAQLRNQVRDSLTANAGSYLQMRTGNLDDARAASVRLGEWPVEDLMHMRDLTAAAVISRDGVPSQAFSLDIDFFKKNQELLADTELREWRLEQVRRQSYETLVQPYENSPLTTPDTIDDQLKAVRNRDREERLKAMRETSIPVHNLDPHPAPKWLSV